jgi:hypothetical protein
MNTLKRFRLMAVRLSLALSVVAAGITFFVADRVIAQGLLMGGLAGTLAFWLLSFRVEKLATAPPGQLKLISLRWSAFRYAIYGVALYRAYVLDTETYHAFIAAAVGLLIIHVVLVFLALTGMDMQGEDE